ncbi:phenazine biosynthesis protein PhzF [Solitalea longa]|uniref:Phenazine biosynthesis protein PhzF n=1 Tax=Solitalea longa TaxID=2079460 RepID=A0A2S5A067_9SPHI|nr:PhzF family phenazine biosynthesis isomerase [Solitalea longa]POY35956.1 phenazine biosynthesis protein PhzF [Solitalea longa]
MKTYFVDSFTTEKFKGNPAAVCITEIELSAETMQSIATEIGFSETAFIQKTGENAYKIRFYTPKQEIALCGHATLAASKIIFDNTGLVNISFINCEEVELKIEKMADKIVMQFPVYETSEMDVPQAVFSALGIKEVVNTRFSQKNKIILIEINDSDKLAALQPDFQALLNSYSGINGVLVTALSNSPDFDFQYRYFWPWAGTNEDPVTGGIQTFLTKYWAEKLNKNKLKAFQSSLRTGMMTIELIGGKVFIYGEAVIVFEGVFKN